MRTAKGQRRGVGRPAKIHREAILEAGRALGMQALSVKAVAGRLGVTPAALYRHLDGRWELERLVGEDLLEGLVLRDEGGEAIDRHLLSFGLQLRDFLLRHPGLAEYMLTLFPRGEGGRKLMRAEVEALVRRGYAPGSALALCSSVASLTIALVASEARLHALEHEDSVGLSNQRAATLELIGRDPVLLQAHLELPPVNDEARIRLMLLVAIRGFTADFPPGRTVSELTHALRVDD